MEENKQTFIRAREIALKYGMGVSTVWKWTANGDLPKPQKLGKKMTVWNADEVDSVMKEIARTSTDQNISEVGVG
tara:strand:- start:697 stop:921 length:225 start_codon:yes stop_codon:yes gene_type:complete